MTTGERGTFGPTDDVRIRRLRPLLPPAIAIEELPLAPASQAFIGRSRREIADVIHGRDRRLLVVVGPCSIHDVDAAREYALRLRALRDEVEERLLLVMRVYFEKPRTTVGWKGLINDPLLDGSYRINEGLRLARELLVDIAGIGVPAGCEFLDTITPQFTADTVSWAAIGARTTESQVHRELASGLSMPVGFKNGTDGSVQIAIDAVTAVRNPHCFLSVTKQGIAAIVETDGNLDAHVILRGSSRGPNHDAEAVAAASAALERAGCPVRLMVDCSHGNSQKIAANQPGVARSVAARRAAGERAVMGLMIESNLLEGRQDPGPRAQLRPGVSITDACIGWDETAALLRELASIGR